MEYLPTFTIKSTKCRQIMINIPYITCDPGIGLDYHPLSSCLHVVKGMRWEKSLGLPNLRKRYTGKQLVDGYLHSLDIQIPPEKMFLGLFRYILGSTYLVSRCLDDLDVYGMLLPKMITVICILVKYDFYLYPDRMVFMVSCFLS